MLKIHHHSHLGLWSKSYGLTFSCKIRKKKPVNQDFYTAKQGTMILVYMSN